VTGACTYRLANGVTKEGATVIGDSWFGSVKAALSLKKDLKCEFIGNVKTSHSLCPKAYSLKDHPVGSRLVMTAMVGKKQSWTSVVCEKCDLPLCSPIGKHGRLCGDLHCNAHVEELRGEAKRHRVDYATTSCI